jgi:hypothetical protein
MRHSSPFVGASSAESRDRERRFVASVADPDALAASLAGDAPPIVLDAARPIAFARTTYLDTADGRLLANSLAFGNGVPRVHVRIREYAGAVAAGDAPTLTNGRYLEIKHIDGENRRKLRWRLSDDVAVHEPAWIADAWHRARAEADAKLGALATLDGASLAPVVTSLYRRTSFVIEHGVRITIDSAIEFATPASVQSTPDRFRPAAVAAYGGRAIVEVKFERALPPALAAALRPLTESPSLSKFHLGMAAVPSGATEG